MKKLILIMMLLGASVGLTASTALAAYNFGDFRSETLVSKAWSALAENDIEGVLVYTNKCLELYAEQAKKMQDSLSEFPTGSNDDIFAYWALNDVATSLFIQGEAYRKANMKDDAKAAYTKVIEDYTYGQTWDTQGWFWKPSEAAKDKLAMINSGSNLDFGDYTSSFLTTQAWKALMAEDVQAVEVYTNKVIELYAEKARNMQQSLAEYPWESKEKIFSYWALNDVGTSYYIQGEAYKKAGKNKEAREAYQKLVDSYSYAQCWDPKGWFWKPSEAAVQAIDELSS